MKIRHASAAERRRSERAGSVLRREMLGLAAASLVVGVGLALVVRAKSASFGAVDRALRAREILNLEQARRADEIAPFLDFLPHEPDRYFAAQKIQDALAHGPLPNVGTLAKIRVPWCDIEAAPQLRELRERGEAVRAAQQQERDGVVTGASVPLLTAEQLETLKPELVVRTPAEFRHRFELYVALYFAAFWIVHLLWRLRRSAGDPLLLPVAHLLSGVGLVLMIALRDPLRDVTLFAQSCQGAAAGCVLLWLCSRVDYQHGVLRRLAFVPLLGAVALSLLLVVFGSGPGGSDAKVNLFGVQPVEAIRILLVLFLAGWFSSRWESLRELHETETGGSLLLRRLRLPRRAHLLPVLAGVGIGIAFYFLQRDLGPALVFSTLFLALYGLARRRVRLVTLGLGVMILAFWISYTFGFPRTVALRVGMWLSPWENGLRRGDQLAHSLWAFASGGTTGTGLGLGRPSVVPAAHTDLVLSAAGEELGFVGVLAILALYAVLVVRGFRIARRAPGDYTFFLAAGFTASTALQVLLISGGALGLVPLSGVVTPFLSYGRTALLAHFAVLGILRSISERRGPAEATRVFHAPLRALSAVLAALGIVVLGKAAWVQVVHGDDLTAASGLVVQADGLPRYQDNPRLREAAALIPRGTVYDRNGLPLATSDWSELEKHRAEYERLGISIDRNCPRADARWYPLAGVTYHVLGDWNSKRNWAASNTSFVERDSDPRLRGFGSPPRVVEHRDPRTGDVQHVLKYDYRELVPLWRHHSQPGHREVQKLLSRPRDVRLTLDARLQLRTAAALKQQIVETEKKRGAAVVLDPSNGDLLASVSYPWPTASETRTASEVPPDADAALAALVDRARYGMYPPGSVFKLVVAAAALRQDHALRNRRFPCRRLGDGRVGNVVLGRTVRDDPMDETPHGNVDMHTGLVVSCNAYFAQLGMATGAAALRETADLFDVSLGPEPSPKLSAAALRDASYGQGTVVVTPLQMARVAGAIAAEGTMQRSRWIAAEDAKPEREPRAVLAAEDARTLARDMRDVVRDPSGTAHRRLSGAAAPIAGKTGTAQVAKAPSHSWFVGFAPYGGRARRIAFAVLIENGGYGGGVAAPLAGEIVTAARQVGLVDVGVARNGKDRE